ACGFRGLHRADVLGTEPQQNCKQLEPHPAQDLLAEDAFADVNDVFESAVNQHQKQKSKAQDHQVRKLIDLETPTEHELGAAEKVRQRNCPIENWRRHAPCPEGMTLQRVTDDQPGNIQRGKVKGQRGEDQQKDANLLATT